MDKRDYFLTALKSPAGRKRHWVNSVFSVVLESQPIDPYPYQLFRRQDGLYYRDPDDFSTEHPIHTEDPDGPLCGFLETFMLAPGELTNYPEGPLLPTTYGNVLVNHLALCGPFGSEIPFQKGEFKVKAVEAMLLERLVDDPEDPETQPEPGQIFVRQLLAFNKTVLSLVAYNRLAVHSVTPKSMLKHPDARRLRAELMEQYKGRLNDPVTIAKISDALEQLDREWLADDPAMGFYNVKPSKYFGGARSRQFYLFGGEAAFSDGSDMKLLPYSLEEGIDPDQLPAMINSLREGSYYRGIMTQLGGESTKIIYRMLGTTRIIEEDCGTRRGVNKPITSSNADRMVGFYAIINGEDVLLTNDNIQSYVGQTLLTRNPLTCRNVCARCLGTMNAELENGIPATAAQLGGRFLTAFLKKMHTSSLRTAPYDPKQRLL